MRAFQAGSNILREAPKCCVEAFPVEPSFIDGIEEKPSFSRTGQPCFEELYARAIECCFRTLVGQFLDAQKECRFAEFLELAALMAELLGFSAGCFGKQDDSPPSA
jgi:hypothetical protein